MILKRIELKNIRSYEEQQIEFSEGSTLLSGDIGSGKTTILLAIEFALFGLQPGQRGASLLKNGKDEGRVIIEFIVDDNEVIIERSLKRKKTVSQEYCAITINNEKRELSVTELKNKVLELLNYPKEFSKKQNILYKFTVYTPQEEMKQIILQDPETRINTLRHVFGIDKYKKIIENVSIVALKIREEKRLKEGITINLEQDKLNLVSKESDLEAKRYNLSSVEKELFNKQEQRKKTEEEKLELYKKIEEKNKLSQEVEKTRIIVENKEQTIIDNKKVLENLTIQVNELKEIKYDEGEIVNLERELIIRKEEKQKLDKENLRVNSEISANDAKNSENIKLENQISNLDICPTCLQDVDSVYRANVLNKMHNDTALNNKKIKNLTEEKNEVNKKMMNKEEEISSIQKKITELKILKIKLREIQDKDTRIKEIEKLNITLDEDINLLKSHNEALKSNVLELSKYDNLHNEKENQLQKDIENERQAEIKVAELKKEIDLYSIQIDELTEKIKKSEEIQKQLSYLTRLEDWLTKKFVPLLTLIEKSVMIKLKQEFSKLFAEWFNILVSDSFEVRLSDDFTPIVEQQDYEIDYAYLSGGERTAIALAYRLSLNQVINSLLSKIKTRDVVILDEPTDGFSEQQLDKMRDVLGQLDVKQLIIVSHEQKIEDFVENVIRFSKVNGISQMESI